MGCWNGTCMISQLPIFYGDEVVLILLKKRKNSINSSDSCYCNEFFLPYPCIIYGKYDDYGTIEDITGDIDIMYEILESELKITEEDVKKEYNNKYGTYNKKEKTYAYLKYIQSNRNILDIGFVLIHKKLFDNLIPLDTNDNYFVDRDEMINSITEQYLFEKKIKDLVANDKLKEAEDYIMNNNKIFHGNSLMPNIQLTNINKESVSKIVAINSALSSLRKLWFPQTGSGSQEQITDHYKVLNEFMSEKIKNKPI